MAIINDAHCCFICDQQFQAGEMVLSDVNEGLGHRACFGDDREGYVKDIDTGEPLGPYDPIPAGEPYVPAEYFPLRNAQSEAVAWGKPAHPSAVEPFFIFDTDRVHDWQKAVFTIPLYTHPAPQSEAVAVKAMDRDRLADLISRAGAPPGPPDGPIRALPETHFLRVQAYKQADAVLAALTHPAPPLAVTDEMVERACVVGWYGIVSWEAALKIAASDPNSSCAIAVPMHRKNVHTIITAALQAIAGLPTGKSEEVMEGQEQAYRAVERLAHPGRLASPFKECGVAK